MATYAISDLMGIPEADRSELVDLLGAPPSQVEGDAVHRIGPDPLIFIKERFDGLFARPPGKSGARTSCRNWCARGSKKRNNS